LHSNLQGKKFFILFESASGYALFRRQAGEEIGAQLDEVQESILDMSKFAKIVKFVSFSPFSTAENALENINAVSDGVLTNDLKVFLEKDVPEGSQLGVSEEKLAAEISENLKVKVVRNDLVRELIRGIRNHFPRFIKKMEDGDLERAQLGLGHRYSRAKVKFNVNKVDNMIIQSIALLDQIEKDCNTFAMRCREWYSWHFPELNKLITDNYTYARVVKLVGDKKTLTEAKIPDLEELVGNDSALAKTVLDATRSSMGTDISEIDLLTVERFANRVEELSLYRRHLQEYLFKKMHDVAPNLSELIGEHVGARLIAHAGSLVNLAKAPASTVQILGAEKALFRALKTRGNTPKYGLIFNSTFIGRASLKNKGRISRYLANKASIAARIDSFSDAPTTAYGSALKDQVEQRLRYYDTGEVPPKNVDVMEEVAQNLKASRPAEPERGREKSKKEKSKPETAEKAEKSDRKSSRKSDRDQSPKRKKSNKKDKKDKKSKKSKK
jgi:nucleolar protein 56